MRDAADKEHLYTLLMGLNETYTAIRSHTLAVQPTPTLAQAYNMVAEDGQQREISGSSKCSYEATVLQTTTPQVGSDAAAFQVKGRNSDSRPD
ncbi:hypothetical protein LINGRAHAP2_LOCUS30276, partial [Linum grandiflorum]